MRSLILNLPVIVIAGLDPAMHAQLQHGPPA
jgi:hypothetical protein